MARTIKMLSDMNTTMMEVERVDRVGDRLMVTGVMMGNFPAEIYLEPADLITMAVMHLRPSPLGFVVGLPYFWVRCAWRADEAGTASRLRAVASAVGVTLGGLLLVAVLGVGTVGVARWLWGLVAG